MGIEAIGMYIHALSLFQLVLHSKVNFTAVS